MEIERFEQRLLEGVKLDRRELLKRMGGGSLVLLGTTLLTGCPGGPPRPGRDSMLLDALRLIRSQAVLGELYRRGLSFDPKQALTMNFEGADFVVFPFSDVPPTTIGILAVMSDHATGVVLPRELSPSFTVISTQRIKVDESEVARPVLQDFSFDELEREGPLEIYKKLELPDLGEQQVQRITRLSRETMPIMAKQFGIPQEAVPVAESVMTLGHMVAMGVREKHDRPTEAGCCCTTTTTCCV